ncbi:MAG TPA: response regulator, partial [Frankiaceae bacterium]|nr:response regulator [Frankiaceae bacterium]
TEAERSAGRGEPDTGWLELPDPDDHPLPREHARSPDVAALLRRTVRWVTITALVYRVVAPPSSVAGYMGAVGPSHAVAVIAVATVVTLATAAFLAALASGRARDLLWSRWFFLADIGVGAALNLWAAASLPARTLDQPFRDVFWYYLIGATGMWVAVRGVRAGLLVAGVSAPLQLAMCLVNGLALDTHVVAQMLARSLWLVLSIVVGSVILPLLRLGTRLALAEGLHTGQKVEQARLNRAMHDTVLQTLEAIALRAGDEHEAPADRLREVRAAARRQADELRRMLRDDATAVTDLAAALRALAEEFAGLGLRVELVTAELGREPLSVEVGALRDAVREALANTWKHAGGPPRGRPGGVAPGPGGGLRPRPRAGLRPARRRRVRDHPVDHRADAGDGRRRRRVVRAGWGDPRRRLGAPVIGRGNGSPAGPGEDAGPLRVAVVEDHPLYREALVRELDRAEDLSVVGAAQSVEEYDAKVPERPDVVVLDLNLPGLSGAAAVEHVAAAGVSVLVLSASADEEAVVDALGAGAKGYLSKDADGVELVAAARAVGTGGSYVSPALAGHLLVLGRADRSGGMAMLTEREREILALVADGETDQTIAAALHITVSTVRSHLDRIRDKTGRRRRADLTRLAVERAILPRPRRSP